MAHGPAPKPAERRARRNKDPIITTIDFVATDPPYLPEVEGVDWHPMTVTWWETLRESPLAALMMRADWSFMIDTALLHTQYWSKGHWTLAAEIRLRTAKMGIMPEDRLRLRIQAVSADVADNKRRPSDHPSKDRFGDLRVLRPGEGEETG